MEEEDWDLHAVVRGCTAASSSAAAASTTSKDSAHDVSDLPCSCFGGGLKKEDNFADALEVEARRGSSPSPSSPLGELHQLLYKPLLPQTQPLIFRKADVSLRSPSAFGGANGQAHGHAQSLLKQQQQPSTGNSASSASQSSGSCTTSSQAASRSKRRKTQLKKVCQVPAESLSSDIWAWRKYGQKPIKGSPYPRGYYRCSSSKGCLARKQVERNRSEPGMFIVTYTAEHNHPAPTHRNSLAGSTRQKPAPPQNDPVHDSTPPSGDVKFLSASPANSLEEEFVKAQSQSPNTESRGEREDSMVDDEGEVGLSDMALSDDSLVGLEGLLGCEEEDCFFDPFPANFGLSWTANNTAATAGGS